MPQNDLETMRNRLRDQLSDADDETWNAGEKEEILGWAVRRLNQRLGRPLDPEAAAQIITMATGDYFYAIDTGITHLWKVEWVSTDDDEYGEIGDGSWEVVGDLVAGTAKLHVSPQIVENGGTLRLHARGRYDLPLQAAAQTSAIPDDYVTLVLATARAECYRRLLADRSRFKQWLNSNQTQNVSINELVQMVNEADSAAQNEELSYKRWQKPVPGRI